jgi:hypothetical protein
MSLKEGLADFEGVHPELGGIEGVECEHETESERGSV